MSRLDLWWLGLAVVAGLAVGMVIRQTHGPVAAVASDTETAELAALKQECIDGAAVGAGNDDLASDCAVLLAAKDTLRGTATLDWSASTAIADWTGIRLAGTPQRVTELRPTYAGLDGSIPAGLGGLGELRHLHLGNNELTGALPAELGSLSKLVSLSVSENELTGALPPELGELGLVVTLSAGGNQLTGAIPEVLFGLPRLAYLELSGNQLTGPIPPIRDGRADMQGILLDDNQLSGSLPVGLGELDLTVLELSGNQFTGCIPQGLRDATAHDLDDLGLSDCTTTTTYTLTSSGDPNGSISPLPGRYLYLDGESVTVTATPNYGYEVARWLDDCAPSITSQTCTLTMDTDRTASVVFKPRQYRLRVTETGEGSVTPGGRTWHQEGVEVTLTASWDDATQDFSWGGDCAGTLSSECVLTMDAAKDVTATFTALPASRCAAPTDADCVLAVYRGAPDDYAQVVDIPADVLLTPDDDGRYHVERGEQVTVVTAAPLPADWTRFYPQQTPVGSPFAVTFLQLIQPVGTTYTFTATEDDAGANLITFDLTAARPFVRPRPDGKPELGDVVVTTVFVVPTLRYDRLDITGAAATAGSYAFLGTAGDAASAVDNFGYAAVGSVELRVHPTDATGTSRAGFYDTVGVGDTFDYRTNGVDCGFRFRVTSVSATASPRTFGLEEAADRYGGRCRYVDDPGAARDVEFVWGVGPGVPGADGVRVMLHDEPTGEGTYRLEKDLPYVIDVPAGIRVINHGRFLASPEFGSTGESSRWGLPLGDAATDSVLYVDLEAGVEWGRVTTGSAVDVLFDQISASIRSED